MRMNETPFRTIQGDGDTREAMILRRVHCPCGFGTVVLVSLETAEDGLHGIAVEERDGREVHLVAGRAASGGVAGVDLLPPGTAVFNPALDVMPTWPGTGCMIRHDVVPATFKRALRVSAAPERLAA